ncbi:MAG: hypothetical protein V2B20_16165 [Pseudomonadota bacterium]
MNKFFSIVILMAVMLVSNLVLSSSASAEEMKMVGAITKITLAGDGKSATAILKDTKSDESVTIEVTDELTLDKFKDKRIVEGDEIRCKFDKEDGKNKSKKFVKTAGC